ncbi:NAD-glutamate dehydrogenase [Sphingomonas sp.]|uniref:NAD-glutamate dehydrogenase n=1 Tax=Sphingomonas sp. TaxID=28214 RepID=UPI0035C7A6F6
MAKHTKLLDALAVRLTKGALPAELEGFGEAEQREATAFLLATADRRQPGTVALALEPLASAEGRRRVRLAIVNDDMPFLVDSIAATLSANNVAIDRIIHPVARVSRSVTGELAAIGDEGHRESLIYIEAERVDARERRELLQQIEASLIDVRAATGDWPRLQDAMAADAAALGATEGAGLLTWFLDRKFTLLGHFTTDRVGAVQERLGIARNEHAVPILARGSLEAAVRWFEEGGRAPLLLKSNLISAVHRAVPLDIVIVPKVDGESILGLSVHAGLWTSAALNEAPEEVPVLRQRLAAFQEKFGFDPHGHTGKALTHAMASLPHDLATAFDSDALEALVLTAMSLADRPRPKLAVVRSPLRRHLFAFVWLPREELTTARRVAIGDMLSEAATGAVLSWSIALEDGDVALIRYVIDTRGMTGEVDIASLDRRLERMVRGWAPSVEAALAEAIPGQRAARLALTWANAFPIGYRNANPPEEAAEDIRRIAALDGPDARSVRLFPPRAGEPLQFKIYRLAAPLALSDVVPVLENFGFRVISEIPTAVRGEQIAYLHRFEVEASARAGEIDAAVLEAAITAVLQGGAENDAFNGLIVALGLSPASVMLLRAWFRYLRQAGLTYGMNAVVDTFRRAPEVASALVSRFEAAHGPAADPKAAADADARIEAALDAISAVDDDRILRAYHAVIGATLRTNAFAPAGREALAFKLDSARIPGLPKPLPWREVWVYSARIEGVHLRAGPVARGGLRWSDRRDDFRTEILGLMKAQRVKNAVIVPTGAKGGFYPKQLPSPANRDAWLAEGTESYRIFIRALLSITDNIVGGKVVHPQGVRVPDGDDPYFVVAADKGTATFSDVANALAIERDFWLGDAFASGGSQGYDHKAMGITAKGAWISVQRHFAERGRDVQTEPVSVVGCGDMSGDVFGNGMLLSQTIELAAAFDHRHIFLDPNPDASRGWAERARLFALPRSSWADYDPALISEGGGVWPRSAKIVPLSPQVRERLGIDAEELEPAALISAILKAPVDLIWFGGIGTYVKARAENNATVGDPANDRLRVDAEDLRAIAVGEGANLGVTQAGRIAFAERGGRINTDAIDNSAGVDCSDNEVNIKIALNAEVTDRRLSSDDRNALLGAMTDEVARLVLEDNRLQTLALSIAERDGAPAVPGYVRAIEIFETAGRLDRRVEGLAGNEELLRRGVEGGGLTRPELAVLLATAKLALQDAIEDAPLATDDAMLPDLRAAFPAEMQARFGKAIDRHQLRGQIVATKLANRIVNRLGILHPYELAEEEGAALADIAAMFVVVERLFDLPGLWRDIETQPMPEEARLALFEEVAVAVRAQIADLLRVTAPGTGPAAVLKRIGDAIAALDRQTPDLLLEEARAQSARITETLSAAGAPPALVARVVRLFELDGAVGLADLGERERIDVFALTRAFTRLGQALGLDWAQASAARLAPSDPWERLLIAGLARDFQQLRLDFLGREGRHASQERVDAWLEAQAPRVAQFRAVIDRARRAPAPSAPMLAQIAGQARVLLGR